MKIHIVIVIVFVLAVCLAAAYAVSLYRSRFLTAATIEKLTEHHDGFDLYRMAVKYRYDPDRVMARNFRNDQMVMKAILREALPFLPIRMEVSEYACSSFSLTDADGRVLMGRNYDFTDDTSAMLVYCTPEGGYASIGMAALDHVQIRQVRSRADKLRTMPAPLICLDGMNEKGVAISVHWMDSAPTRQSTGKPKVFTTLAIRLVLDRAATTQEAVDLLRGCDMYAVSGGDYQYFITDSSGDSRVVEYDCLSEDRKLVDLPVRTATNFYQLYIDQVLPNQENGIYGHGRERYDRVEAILSENEKSLGREIAWQALETVQQLPADGDVTSNTQWSVVYNTADLTAEVTLRRHWGEINLFSLKKLS